MSTSDYSFLTAILVSEYSCYVGEVAIEIGRAHV